MRLKRQWDFYGGVPEKMQNYKVLIHEVALECIENMTEEDRAYIRMHPDTSRYHFGYGMYIRNKYGPRFSDVGVYIHRDNISSDVLSEIVFAFCQNTMISLLFLMSWSLPG